MLTCSKQCYRGTGVSPYEWQELRDKITFSIGKQTRREREVTIRTRLAIALKEKSAERIAKHVPLTFKEEFSLTDGKAVMVDLCETCYMNLYHTQSKRTFQSWKADEKMKRFQNSVLSGAIGMGTMKSKRKRNYMGAQYANVLDADKACAGKGLDDTELRALCVPDNDASRQAFRWMTKFFKKYCEKPPNLTTTQQLPSLYTKGSIYKMMVQQLESEESTDEHAVISEEAFLDLWLATYPNVRITKFISVCGKCDPCAWLHEREELFKGEDELEIIQQFANFHKIFIHLEKDAYYDNRQLAKDYPTKYMSLIIDGMSQSHCALPHKANKVTYKKKVTQHIQGAKQHYFSKSLYRTFPHVKADTNLACHVLLREIERRQEHCLENNIAMPNILFVRIDGGSENANKVFYALCEQLVRDGVFEEIEVARLPVGHTHEDIDALFGVLWRALQNKTIMTPQDWEAMARKAFRPRIRLFSRKRKSDE